MIPSRTASCLCLPAIGRSSAWEIRSIVWPLGTKLLDQLVIVVELLTELLEAWLFLLTIFVWLGECPLFITFYT